MTSSLRTERPLHGYTKELSWRQALAKDRTSPELGTEQHHETRVQPRLDNHEVQAMDRITDLINQDTEVQSVLPSTSI